MPRIAKKYTMICAKCGEPFKAATETARYCFECKKYPIGDPYNPVKKRVSKIKKLRRCPFCGSEANMKRYTVAELPRFRCECSNENCIANNLPGRDFLTEEDARRAWNGRV